MTAPLRWWRSAGLVPTVNELRSLRPGTTIDPQIMDNVRARILQIRALYATAKGARVPLRMDEPLGLVCLLPAHGEPDWEIAMRCAVCNEWLRSNSMLIEMNVEQQRANAALVNFDQDGI